MRIQINEDQSLEELSVTLQIILAYLEDNKVDKAGRVNIYLTPLRKDGDERTLDAVETERFKTFKDKPKNKFKKR
jgi:hypothetical protein